MDCKSVGATIARLRKESGMTQLALAEHLEVTDKAVSRWENGLCYPDIALLPTMAQLFGVSVDYLLMGQKRGIAVAGNIILDIVNSIDSYPESGMIAHMSGVSAKSVGGCVSNIAIDLAKMDPGLCVHAYGKVGRDENGRFILSKLQRCGVNVDKVLISEELPTSFCDVMSVPSGERTFFSNAGANADFSPRDIDVSDLHCEILHIGYVFLLEQFDAPDEEYGTAMARFLHDVQQQGVKTSIDMVSDSMARFDAKLQPMFRYCDYVIINEMECCMGWGLNPRRADGSLDEEHVLEAMRRTVDAGVRNRVIVHAKECSYIMNAKKEYLRVSSLKLPPEKILGSVGAGDAFCAGCLYGIYHSYSDRQLLEFASCAAACSLFAANSVDGMQHKNEIMKLSELYERL